MYIKHNAWINHSLMSKLRATAPLDPNATVLQDQEKAYDRLNSDYLTRVRLHFVFPAILVSVLSSLFFQNADHLVHQWMAQCTNSLG